MITGKIKSLFVFIEFLHSNIDNFNNQNSLIKELELLYKERDTLNPEINYKEKIKFDEVQTELENKFDTLQNNTANLIRGKANELRFLEGVKAEIQEFKKHFSNEDLTEIIKHKNLYLEYRIKTHKTFLSLELFYKDLDKITKTLFDYFKETNQNEFEAFEKKKIEINSFVEPFASPEQMNTKFVFATPFNKTKLNILEQLADKLFFQIDQVADFEFEGKIYQNVKQKNNDSILTPENWEQYKDIFFEQRMNQYKENYTISEKIKLELETVEKLPINKTDYKILSDRYRNYLDNKHKLQQPETNKPDVNFEFENNFDRVKNTAVYDFFKTKLVDKKYLTVDSLHNYLKVAFENQQPPLTKFSFENKYLIKDIRKIFYDYFSVINTEKYSAQDRYIKLLTDYFEGFDFEKIKNNFNK